MNAKLRQAYRTLRAQHPTATARTLLTWARTTVKAKPAIDWNDDRRGLPCARWSEHGFDIVASVGLDDHGTVEWLGSFHERQVSGAIRVPAPAGYRSDAHGCCWYLPEVSYSEHYKGLLAMKFGRAESDRLARSYVAQDAKRLARYCDGDLCLLVVGATVYRAGVELASSGLHGIDVDSPSDPYISEVARDMAHEALIEARAKLAELCPRRRKSA